MDKLEEIQKTLRANSNLVIGNIRSHRSSLSKGLSVLIPIWPSKPAHTVERLRKFTGRQREALLGAQPFSACSCYEYPSVGKNLVKLGALYFYDLVEDPAGSGDLQREIIVSIYPCKEMASSGAIRQVLQLGSYECKVNCKASKECAYKRRGPRMLFRLRTR